MKGGKQRRGQRRRRRRREPAVCEQIFSGQQPQTGVEVGEGWHSGMQQRCRLCADHELPTA